MSRSSIAISTRRTGVLLEADYFCRLRVEDDRVTATLKSLGGASGAVHRRDEQEVELPAWTPMVAEWPDGPARELALKLTGEAPLEPLFEIRQRRAAIHCAPG